MSATTAEHEFYYASKYLSADDDALTEQTADAGGTVSTIVDSALTEADDYWNGAILRFEDDTTTASLQGLFFHVTDFDAATDTLTVVPQMPVAPSAGDTYRLILGGNWRSSQRVYGMTATGLSNVTGVTIDYAGFENGAGSGTLTFVYNGGTAQTLAWTKPSGTIGAVVNVHENGTYHLFDADGQSFLTVTVVAASLPGSNTSDTIVLAQPSGNIIPHCEASETTAGIVRHYLISDKNASANTMIGAVAYLAQEATATGVTSTVLGLAEGVLTATCIATYPATGWIYNSTKTDCRPYRNKSGTSVTCYAADWSRIAFSAGATQINIGDTIEGATSGKTGVVMSVQVNSGAWGTSDAAGYIYIKDRSGAFQAEDLNVSSSKVAESDGADALGFRDLAAVEWEVGDTIYLMPNIDIGLDAPDTLQFENPATQSDAPAGVTFSAPITVATGLSIGDLATTEIYGVWARETVVDGAYPRANVTDSVIVSFSAA